MNKKANSEDFGKVKVIVNPLRIIPNNDKNYATPLIVLFSYYFNLEKITETVYTYLINKKIFFYSFKTQI
ncbi:protein of unknown function [Legionella fallonii LLAP-10]|uniref:Uncharacterized protein n=1 Tax=Legionella fallonii LLAP-10 TaxID=1212491 RepID=A0A098G7Q9_9GAMM|nr:protein of unknown function [Legionella fallonii LLAP-10]